MAGFSPYGALPRKLGLLSMWGDPNSAATMPAGVRGLLAGKVAPAQDDEEADAPAANASPAGPAPMNVAPQGMLGVPADVPLPPPRPAEFGGQAQAAQPSTASPEKTGFDGFLDKLGNIYGSGGPGDPLITLGLSLMGEGDIGTRVQRGMEAMSKQKLLSAQGDLQKNKLAGQNATAKLISERMNIPLDQAMGLVSSGGANTVLGQIFQKQNPQLVDVPQADGSTVKKWITPGQSDGVSVGTKPADENYRPLSDPAEREKYGIRPEDKNPYQIDGRGKVSAIGGNGTNVSVSTAVNPILKGLGDQFVEGAAGARSAAEGVRAIHNARTELDRSGGIIAGTGADARLAWAKIGAALGADANQVYNTETFMTQMKPIVLETVKGLGAGSGISNADRDFALQAVGGKITLDEGSIRRVLDITERAHRAKIDKHNALADKMLSQQPDLKAVAPMLRIDAPPEYAKPDKPKVMPSWRVVR